MGKKKFNFLIFLTFFSSLLGFSEGFCRQKIPQKEVSFGFFDKIAHPLARNVACYTKCPQSVGSHGALALEALRRQHPDLSLAELFQRIEAGEEGEEAYAKAALRCLQGCRVKTTVKFLARFLGTLRTPELVRAVGHMMGQVQYAWEGQVSETGILKDKGAKTNLGQVVFGTHFKRKAKHVLRHMGEEKTHLEAHMDALRHVYYELYGMCGCTSKTRRASSPLR